MSRIAENLQRVCEYLDSQDWEYDVVDECTITFRMGIRCQFKSCGMYIHIRENKILVYALAPINAAEEARAATAEFITRANYGMQLGNFEMDYSDGEVRYKTCLFCPDEAPDLKIVEFHVDIPFRTLLKNMLGFGNPEKDIAAIEGE